MNNRSNDVSEGKKVLIRRCKYTIGILLSLQTAFALIDQEFFLFSRSWELKRITMTSG